MLRPTFLSLLLFAFAVSSFAQRKAVMVSIGTSSQLDTYLSPEHYSGPEIRFIHHASYPHSNPLWHHEWNQQVAFSTAKPRSKDSSLLSGMYSLSWSLFRSWDFSHRLRISGGGMVEAFLGGTYNTRNGNNPAQLHTGLALAPTAKADWQLEIAHRPCRLSYSCSLPLIGTQFSPAYGQSYYEIFAKGNYDHNICLTHPGNAFSFTQQLSIDVPMGKKALRLGYLGDYRQAELNNLKYHNFTHSFIIGYVY